MRISSCVLFYFLLAVMVAGCGGGGGGSDGGSPSQNSSFSSTINGTVVDVLASSKTFQKTTFFAELKELLSLSTEANAQDSGLSGILVEAFLNGVVVASAITNSGGAFTLVVPPGEITLVFHTQDSITSTVVTVPQGGTLTIAISIVPDEPNGIVVREMVVEQGPIVCGIGVVEIPGGEVIELIIDGGGQDCIRAEGTCSVILNPDNLTLQNCSSCINASNGSEVIITAQDGDFVCQANEDGVMTENEANVTIGASNSIDISSSGNSGIKTTGSSQVQLVSDSCTIEGPEGATNQEGDSIINTEECTRLELVSPSSDLVCELVCEAGICEEVCVEMEPPPDLTCEQLCDGEPNEAACIEGCNATPDPQHCSAICEGEPNEAQCKEECEGGDVVCDEVCREECLVGDEVCEHVCIREEEVCDEVCVADTEVCAEKCIRDEDVCTEVCVLEGEVCVEEVCVETELVCELVCEAGICEEVCGEVCVREECVRTEIGCLEEVRECDSVCVETGIFCESECIEHTLVCENVCVEDGLVCEGICLEVGVTCEVVCEPVNPVIQSFDPLDLLGF